MRAYDIMTWGVTSVEAHTPVMRAAQLMLEHNTSGLPVLDKKGRLAGIVTEDDFIRRDEIGTRRRRPSWLGFLIAPSYLTTEIDHACGQKVDEIMTPNPYSVTGNTALEEVVQLMEKHRIKYLPVIEEDQVIGTVSLADLMRAFLGLAWQRRAQSGTVAAMGGTF
jgi:CBS domain-containing protein